jgi:hypothetical protein
VKTSASHSAAFGLLSLALGLAAVPTAGRAAPLSATAAVQTLPDPAAPIVTYLKAGSEPAPATDPSAVAPPGWIAVDLAGPFEAYVLDKDFTKGLDVKPGSALYLAPKPDAGILATAAKGDQIEIIGLYGKWTQVRLDKHLTGYVNLAPPTAHVTEAAPAAPAVPAAAPAAALPEPAAGQPVAQGTDAALPRILEGTFQSTRHAFVPRRPFDWEIVDSSGTRLAYLDLSKLLLTEQPATYNGKSVVVSGSLHATEGKEFVLAVESLQLR